MGKKVNVTGLILLFAGTVIAGCIISAAYLLLMPLLLGLDVKFGVILALFFGGGIGALMAVLIKFLKIDSTVGAGIIVAIGCLCFSYFKWGLYLANDYGDFYKSEDFEDYLGLCEYADENFTDPLHKPYSESAIKDILANLGDDYTYFGDTREEAAANVYEFVTKDSWYGYYCDLRDANWNDPSAVYYMSRPAAMFERIGQINYEGRWELHGNMLNGVPYAVAWLAEFLLICVPAVVIAVGRAANTYVMPKVPKGEVGSVAVRDVFADNYGTGYTGVSGTDMGSVGYTAPYVPPTMQTSSAVEAPDAPETADYTIPDDNFDFSAFSDTGSAPFGESATEEPQSEPDSQPEVTFDNFDDFFK